MENKNKNAMISGVELSYILISHSEILETIILAVLISRLLTFI
jgi:hypothetical protein